MLGLPPLVSLPFVSWSAPDLCRPLRGLRWWLACVCVRVCARAQVFPTADLQCSFAATLLCMRISRKELLQVRQRQRARAVPSRVARHQAICQRSLAGLQRKHLLLHRVHGNEPEHANRLPLPQPVHCAQVQQAARPQAWAGSGGREVLQYAPRLSACSSTAAFHQGSMRNTMDAAVRFRPTPPARREVSMSCTSGSVCSRRTHSARRATGMEPSSRTKRMPRSFSTGSSRSSVRVHCEKTCNGLPSAPTHAVRCSARTHDRLDARRLGPQLRKLLDYAVELGAPRLRNTRGV